ncbi:MAG TPA: helix-turn-helix domain-containing protein [Solirubrobacteraceae bacterium]|nr:helix-turn-helix domain-containing protein [Solirubrobacteraceae bacterium]
MDHDPATLTVGELARLSGLTPKALRHYHDLGVLVPVRVDSGNGYRRYGRQQVEVARQIRVLRELDVPLADIRVIVQDASAELAQSRLRAHRDRLGSRLASLQTSYYFLNKMLEDKESSQIMPKRPTSISLEPDRQRALAAELFNYVWTLMETEEREPRQTQMMVAAAYASRFFWDEIGEPFTLARGEWQISRACAVAGRPVEALEHAQACLDLCHEHQLGAFDVGFAHEAFARAHQVGGDSGSAAEHAKRAREQSAEISDPDDRDLLISDLAALGF